LVATPGKRIGGGVPKKVSRRERRPSFKYFVRNVLEDWVEDLMTETHQRIPKRDRSLIGAAQNTLVALEKRAGDN